MITVLTIYGQCAWMKRTNEKATLNNWKRDETEMNSMEKGETRNNKVGKGFTESRNYVVWSLRSITSAPSSVALIHDDLIEVLVLVEKLLPKQYPFQISW